MGLKKGEFVKAAGVLVMTDRPEPRFLLMRHPDRWDLPKGHCDDSETYREAAARELEEETGIRASDVVFDDDFRFDIEYAVTYVKQPGEVFHKKVRYFLARIPDIVPIRLTEHPYYEWFDWSPPHQIQVETIDPLLASVAAHLEKLSHHG